MDIIIIQNLLPHKSHYRIYHKVMLAEAVITAMIEVVKVKTVLKSFLIISMTKIIMDMKGIKVITEFFKIKNKETTILILKNKLKNQLL